MSGLHDPPLGESDTRSKLIDPAIHARGWSEEKWLGVSERSSHYLCRY
ncbi:MAG: hypothetical protein WD049_08150 [Candidatus Paceibacterota bacterium]